MVNLGSLVYSLERFFTPFVVLGVEEFVIFSELVELTPNRGDRSLRAGLLQKGAKVFILVKFHISFNDDGNFGVRPR